MPRTRSEWNELRQVELHGFEFIPACIIDSGKAARKIGTINSTWGAGLGVIHFGDSFTSSDRPSSASIPPSMSRSTRTADGNNNISPGQSRTFKPSARTTFQARRVPDAMRHEMPLRRSGIAPHA